MNDGIASSIAAPVRPAWNKGKLTGSKPPLRPGHVWLIRAKLQLEKRTRDLARRQEGVRSVSVEVFLVCAGRYFAGVQLTDIDAPVMQRPQRRAT